MTKNQCSHWKFPTEFDVNDWYGFIYRIVNKTTRQEYIGKKQFFSVTRKKVVGRKNRKIVTKESNWKSYMSSSNYVKADIEEQGKDNFTFIIEALVKTKAALNYKEIEMQVMEDVLRARFDNGEKRFYNNAIGTAVKFIPPDESPEESEMKLTEESRSEILLG